MRKVSLRPLGASDFFLFVFKVQWKKYKFLYEKMSIIYQQKCRENERLNEENVELLRKYTQQLEANKKFNENVLVAPLQRQIDEEVKITVK
jgi:hypothetical protein